GISTGCTNQVEITIFSCRCRSENSLFPSGPTDHSERRPPDCSAFGSRRGLGLAFCAHRSLTPDRGASYVTCRPSQFVAVSEQVQSEATGAKLPVSPGHGRAGIAHPDECRPDCRQC